MAEYKIFKNTRHEKEKEQTLTLLVVKSGDDSKQKETILEAFKQSISLSEKEKVCLGKNYILGVQSMDNQRGEASLNKMSASSSSSSLYSADRRPQHVGYSTPYEREHVRIVRQTPPSGARKSAGTRPLCITSTSSF